VETEDIEGNLLSNSVEQGGHGMMDLGGGHGRSSSCTGSEHEVRERKTEGKEERRRGRRGVAERLQGGLLVGSK
jgi:hypothetical protein